MKFTVEITPDMRSRITTEQSIEIDIDTRELDADRARLDFLEECVMRKRVITAERDRDPFTDSELPTVTLFTVVSRHVNGVGFRGAIDAAIDAASIGNQES